MEKKKINKGKVFVFASIICISIYIIFYGARLVYYYIEEHPKTNENGESTVYLSDKIISDIALDGSNNGLFFDNNMNEYYYKGKVESNYVNYSGRLWRIVSINKNNEIKLVTNESQTLLNYKDVDNFKDSYINEWLNENSNIAGSGVFGKTLVGVEEYLTKTSMCNDVIEDVDSIECLNNVSDNKIGLLSLYEYNRSGNANGFMNTEEYFWLNTENKSNNPWYVFSKGGINTEENKNSKLYGVKAVITIKNKVVLTKGDGSYDDPYTLEVENDNQLKNRMIGEYLKYSNYVWRIIGVNEDSVKVILDGYITEGEDNLIKMFSKKTNDYNIDDSKGIAYYLNNTFYNSIIKDYDYVVKGKFNNEPLDIENLDYKKMGTSYIEANVGLPSFGDFYISEYDDVFLMNKDTDADDLIYSINLNSTLFADKYTTEKKVRPVIYLDSSLFALGQEGTKLSPYVIGR